MARQAKATYQPNVSTFLICIIYYGQNHNREYSHGQYYVLAQWLLFRKKKKKRESRVYTHVCMVTHTHLLQKGLYQNSFVSSENCSCYGKIAALQ